MCNLAFIPAALFTILTFLSAAPALAQGEIIITQAKANAGNVTPDDEAGFPVSINEAGSYVLASNLTVPLDKVGIVINAPHVTIDLNGFSLIGTNRNVKGGRGIVGNKPNATIRNGTIAGFKHDGIIGNPGTKNWSIESMRVVGNGGLGIYVGHNSSVRDGTITENGGTGIFCSFGCLVENSSVSENGGYGIRLGDGVILGNVIMDNELYGISGITKAVGYGNNTLQGNNGGGNQVDGFIPSGPLHPNRCLPLC
jgi:hypothetical protein